MNKRRSILLFLSLLNLFTISKGLEEKIKLYTLCTPSHQILKDEWFLPSIQDDYEIIIEYHDQECPTGSYMKPGWIKIMIHKMDLIIQAIQENWNKILIVSDVDIQFFRPTQELIVSSLQDKDIVIQRESPSGQLCAGFFACWGNEKTLKLWQNVKQLMLAQQVNHDQHGLNYLLRSRKINVNNIQSNDPLIIELLNEEISEVLFNQLRKIKNPHNVQWDYLPIEFFGGGTLTGKPWRPGQRLPVPGNIIMHHANWTVGIKNKIAQLTYVRKVVNSRRNNLST